jgi:hypothetical protein
LPPRSGSGYGGELPLDFTIHGALKADEQILVQYGGDPLQGRQLRDMCALLKPRHGTVRSPRSLGDFLLSQSQLKPPFTQMRSDRADLTQSTNALVLSTGVTIRPATIGATTRRLDSGTAYRALGEVAHAPTLSRMISRFSLAAALAEHPDRLTDAEYGGEWELPVLGAVTAPSAVLIRPDGYVAWVGDGTDTGLRVALTAWFGPPTAT